MQVDSTSTLDVAEGMDAHRLLYRGQFGLRRYLFGASLHQSSANLNSVLSKASPHFWLCLPQTHKPCSMTGLFLIHVHSLRARSSMGMQQRLSHYPIAVGLINTFTGRINHCATPVNPRGVVKLEKTPTQPTHAV